MPAMVLVLTPSVVLIVDPTLPMLWQLLQGPASEDIQNYLSKGGLLEHSAMSRTSCFRMEINNCQRLHL